MNKKELADMRTKSEAELMKQVVAKRETLAQTLLDMGIQKEKNLKKAKLLKKDIAQLLTIVKNMSI